MSCVYIVSYLFFVKTMRGLNGVLMSFIPGTQCWCLVPNKHSGFCLFVYLFIFSEVLRVALLQTIHIPSPSLYET